MRYEFAPMEGVTGWQYRRAHHRIFGGVDRYFTPFLSPTQDHVFTPRMRRDVEPARNEGVPTVPQVLTKSASDFLWAAGALADMGYTEVNLNLGCPSGTVVTKGKGSGFLGRLTELEQFLDAVFAAATVPISIKTRLGMTDPAEFWPILELYNRYPIAQLTIHPRVQRDMYKNTPRMDVFEGALTRANCPVCYNGDLVTASQCEAFAEKFPQVQTLMLGRGLVSNPALARQAKGGAAATREELTAFHAALYEGYCTEFGSVRNAMQRMKEVWFYLAKLFDGAEKLEKRLKKATDPREYEAAAAALLETATLRRGLSLD